MKKVILALLLFQALLTLTIEKADKLILLKEEETITALSLTFELGPFLICIPEAGDLIITKDHSKVTEKQI